MCYNGLLNVPLFVYLPTFMLFKNRKITTKNIICLYSKNVFNIDTYLIGILKQLTTYSYNLARKIARVYICKLKVQN